MTQELKTAPVTRQQKRRKPAHSPLAVAWLSVCMVAALGCLWGWLRAGDDAGAGVGTVQATAVLNRQVEAQPPEVPAPPPAHVPLTTMPIEQVRVGQKVPAHNPDRSQVETDTPEVDPATWRLVTMRQTTRTESGGVDVLNIQTIQPLSLIQATHAKPGAMVPVPLDVQEMADVPGPAEVLSIEPCPPIQPGPGQLVLTTVNHLNNFLFDLTVKDAVGKQETISPTGWHKFFSQTRKAWVSACELKEGEKLAGHDGDLTVTGLAREPGVHRVYNMTVQGEHVYYVARLGLLTHNTCSADAIELRQNLIDAGETPQQYAAHIVPSSTEWSGRSEEVQQMIRDCQNWLEGVDIDINDAENGFFTNNANHNGTHTDEYIRNLWEAIGSADGDSNGITNILNDIKNYLSYM